MAYDLSTLIQDGLCNTLQNLLGADTKLNSITKVHEKDLKELELLKIESEFVFDQLTTTLSFVVPAVSASTIFNIQMGDAEAEPSLQIDDDTTDAISEFISTVSGGLTTAINGAEIEDLGKSKFHIAGNEVLQGDSITDIENIYRFSINIDDNEIIIFILFDETILPYLNDITMKPVTVHLEEIEIEDIEEELEEKIDDEPKEDIENSSNEETSDKDSEKVEDNTDEEVKNSSEDEKPENKKLKMLVMGTAGLLGLTILAGIVMYFMGVFDPAPIPVKKEESNTTKESKDIVSVVKYKTLKKVDFKISDINIPRLNTRLKSLTKFGVLSKEELEEQSLAEKNRIFEVDKEIKLAEFAKNNKEESLGKTAEIKSKSTIKKITKDIQYDELKDQDLKFITTNSIKYKFFKDLVLKLNTTQARISICNDKKGRTTIFIGPFENDMLQLKMKDLIQSNNQNIKTSISNITTQEFNTRCNF